MSAINFRFISATLRLRAWNVYGDPKDPKNDKRDISQALWDLAKEFDVAAEGEEKMPLLLTEAIEEPKPMTLGEQMAADIDAVTK